MTYPPLSYALRAALATIALVLSCSAAAVAAPPTINRSINTGELTGRFSLTPSRFEGNVVPGQAIRIPVQLYNGLEDNVRVTIRPVEIGPSEVETSLVQIVDKSRYSATSWIQVNVPELDLASNETASFELVVTPPADIPPGTNFAGLDFSIEPNDNDRSSSRLAFRFSGLMQLFLNAPGAPVRNMRISRTRVSDSFVAGGIRFVTYEVTFANDGNVNEHVSGSVDVRSMFGNKVRSIPIKRMIVLRGSKRTVRAVWTGIPMFGQFSGDVSARSDTKRLHHTLPAVTVLPPWWWLAIMGVALLIPIAYVIHRKRSWRRYLDDEWDDEWLEDDEWDTKPT